MIRENRLPVCPVCGSDDICPSIAKSDRNDNSPLIVFISAFILLGGYFLFVLYSYLFFPVTAIIFAIGASVWLNRRDPFKKKKKTEPQIVGPEEWFCKTCEETFLRNNSISAD